MENLRKTFSIFFLVVALLISAGSALGETLFFEAEDMTLSNNTWGVVPHFGGWYYGDPSRMKMLSGNYWAWGGSAGQGEARKILTIGETRTYRVWVRYLRGPSYLGPFRVSIYENSNLVGYQDFDTVLDPSITYYQFVWSYFDISLTAGQAEIVITKVSPIDSSWITRYIDCFVLTTDSGYTPNIMDFADPLYLKVQMGAGNMSPCVIHFGGRYYRPQLISGVLHYYITGCNIWQNELKIGQYYTGYSSNPSNPNFLTSGEESVWVNIVPVLSYGGQTLWFSAMQDYNGNELSGLPFSDYTLCLSNTPSDDGIFRTFTRTGSGCGIFVDIDILDHSNIKSDIEYSQAVYDVASTLPAVPGKRPTQFSVVTGNAASSDFCQPSTIGKEIASLSAMGFNGIGFAPYQTIYYDNGFTKLDTGAGYFHLMTNGDYSTPNVSAITSAINSAAQAAIDTGKVNEFEKWLFMDEPGSMSISHIVGCSACQEKFRTYLQGLGLQPSDFGKSDWSEVFPTADKGQPKLYYYTVLFRCQILTDVFKLGTDILTQKIPNAPTMANFAEESTFFGNNLFNGVDFFSVFAQGALNLGWTEDWLGYSATYQLCGYRADMLRAACSPYGKQFGMYSIMFRKPWDVEVKPVTMIGHGAQQIYHYNYGPSYIGGDSCSTESYLFPALREVNYAIGAVEDYIVGATVPKSKIALLYSHATDVWWLDETYSAFGKDRMGIYLILRHLGYPVDILTEQDIINGKLQDYEMLICDASHIDSNAVSPLVSWLNGGGTLYIGAGSLMYDQFNSPLGFDSQIGITRSPFVYTDNPGREMYELPYLPNRKPVTYSGNTLESVCGYQKVTNTGSGATVLATFNDDGSPAAFTKPVGNGKLEFCGFFPGLAYQKVGMQTKLARDQSNPDFPTYSSTDWPAPYRNLFASLVGSITVPVMVSNYLVEANRIESASGSIITLSNWTGGPVSDIQVSLARGTREGNLRTVINPVKSTTENSGIITLTMDLAGPCDFIVLPQTNAPPSVAITSPANGTVYTTVPATIPIAANASDPDGTIAKVEFYADTTLLYTDTTSPYSYTWTSVPPGRYVLTAKAYDDRSTSTTSAPVSVRVNIAPSVSITSPADGAVVNGNSVNITANASDTDGTISKVEFYSGTTLLGTDTTSPYGLTWNNVSPGTYTLSAKAYDNNGASTTSSPVSIRVNASPTIALTGPATGTVYTNAPATIVISANASDTDGTISKVEFYSGTTLLGTDTTSPYGLTWNNVPAGSYTLTAKAYDNDGGSATSTAVNVRVNALPSVSITGPSGGTVYLNAPATIAISANASDTDGTISKVEFYSGITLLGTDTTAPYSLTWKSVPSGSYTLTAKAYDSDHVVGISSPVNITVRGLLHVQSIVLPAEPLPITSPTITLPLPARIYNFPKRSSVIQSPDLLKELLENGFNRDNQRN